MDLRPIRARLSSQVAAFRGSVGGQRELLFAMSNPPISQCPAEGFVILGADTAGPNQFATNFVQQKISTMVVVMIRMSNVTEGSEEGNAEELTAVLDSVRHALVGWSPDDVVARINPFTFVKGELAGLLDGVLWWQEVFQTGYLLRSSQNG